MSRDRSWGLEPSISGGPGFKPVEVSRGAGIALRPWLREGPVCQRKDPCSRDRKALLSVYLNLRKFSSQSAVAAHTKASGMGRKWNEALERGGDWQTRQHTQWTRGVKALTQVPGVRTLQDQMFSLRLVSPRIRLLKTPLTPVWL